MGDPFAVVLSLTAGVCIRGSVFDGYYDWDNQDGTFSCGFPRVLVTMDKAWYQNTQVIKGEDETVSFYHTDSYNAFAAEGGRLFTVTMGETAFSNCGDYELREETK